MSWTQEVRLLHRADRVARTSRALLSVIEGETLPSSAVALVFSLRQDLDAYDEAVSDA